MLPAMVEEPDDRTLMVRYRDGDIAAFEVLYSRHKGPLFRYFLRRGMSRDNAAEVFQEVWIRIIRAKDRYKPNAKFTTYMYQIAHNCFVDHFRLQQRRPASDLSAVYADPDEISADPGDEPERQAERTEMLDRFRQALDDLPAEQQEAFVLREEAGFSLADIASVTGVNAETAKSRLRYAVRKLRVVLRQTEDVQ